MPLRGFLYSIYEATYHWHPPLATQANWVIFSSIAALHQRRKHDIVAVTAHDVSCQHLDRDISIQDVHTSLTLARLSLNYEHYSVGISF